MADSAPTTGGYQPPEGSCAACGDMPCADHLEEALLAVVRAKARKPVPCAQCSHPVDNEDDVLCLECRAWWDERGAVVAYIRVIAALKVPCSPILNQLAASIEKGEHRG